MKKIIYVFTLLVFQIGVSQEIKIDAQTDKTIYNSAGVENKPEYPGGIEEFLSFIGKKYKVPRDKNFTGGKVIVSFVVEKDGSLADIKVLRDVGFGSGEEAIRVLKRCKKWKPATQRGIPVRCSYQLPINLVAN